MGSDKGMLAKLGLDTTSFTSGWKRAQVEAAAGAQAISAEILKMGRELAGSFDAGEQAARESFETMRKAAAQLAIEGKKGGTEWKKHVASLKEAKLAADKYDDALDQVEASLVGVGRSSKSVNDNPIKNPLAGGAIQFAAVTAGINALTGAMSTVHQPFLDLERQIYNIGTLGVENFKEFTDITIDLAKTVPDSAATVANAIYQAISAGITGTKKEIGDFVAVASKVAVAGMSDTTAAVDGLTSVINAYGLKSTDVQKVADTFFAGIKVGKTTFNELNASLASFVPLASAMGLSFEQNVGAIAALTAKGTPTAQAATQINAALTLLAKGTEPLNDALGGIGLTMGDLREKLKAPVAAGGGLVNVLADIKRAADASGQEVAALTGRVEAAKLIATLANDVDAVSFSLQKLKDTEQGIAEQSGLTAYETAAESSFAKANSMYNNIEALFLKAFNALGSQFNAIFATVTKMAPIFTAMAGGFTAVNQGAEVFGKLSKAAANAGGYINLLKNGLSKAGEGIASFGKKGLNFLFSWKGAALGAAAGLAAVILGTEQGQEAMKELTESLGKAFAPVIDAVMPLITGIIDAITPILDAIGGVLADIIGSVTGALSGVITGMAQVFGDLFAIIGPLLNEVLAVVVPIIELVGGSLFAAFSNVGEAISAALGSVTQIFSDVFASLQPIIITLSETLTPIFQQLGETIGQVFSTVGLTIAGLVQSFVPIIQQLATTIGPIIEQLAGTFAMLFSVVAEVFGSLLQTIVPIVGELVGTIGTLLGDLLNQVLPLLLPLVDTLAGLFASGLSQIATILKDVFASIAPVIQQVASTIGPIISTIVEVITGVLATVLPIITGILQQLIGLLGPILETVGGLLSSLASTVGTVLADIFATLGPVIEQLAGVLGGILQTLGDVLGTLLSSLKPVIDGLLGVLSTLLPIIGQLVTTLVDALAPIITVIVGVFGQLLGIVGGLVGQIVTALQPVLMTLADLFGQIFGVVGQVVQQLASSLAPILEELSGVFGELVGAVGETVGELLTALVPVIQLVADLVAQLVGWLAGKLQAAFKALTPVITAVAGVAARLLAKALETVVKLFSKLMQVITPVVKAIGQWLAGAIRTIVEWIRGALASALEWLGGILNWIRGAFNTVTSAIGSVIGWIGGFIKKLREASPIINFFGNLIDKVVGFLGDLVGWVKDAVVEFLKFLGILDDAPKKVTIDVVVNESHTGDLEDAAPDPRDLPPDDAPPPPPRDATPVGDKNSDDPFEKELGELGELKETAITNAKATIKDEEQLKLRFLELDREYAKKRLDVADKYALKAHEAAKNSLNDFKGEAIDAGKAFDQARGDLLRRFQEKVAKDGEEFLDRQKEFVDFVAEISADLTTEEKAIAGALTEIEDVRKRLAAADSPLLPEEEELKKALDKIPSELLANPKLKKARDELGKAFSEIDKEAAERLARVEKERAEGIISEAEAADTRVLITRTASIKQTEAVEAYYEDVAKLRAEDAKADVEAEKNRFNIARTFLDATKALVDAFYAYKDQAREGDLQKELDTLKKEEDDLAVSLAKRSTSFADYDKRLGEIAEKRAEINAELNAGAIPLDKRIKDALKVAAQQFASQQNEELGAVLEQRTSLLEEKEDYIHTKVIELGKAGVDQKTALLQAEAEAEELFGQQVIAARERMYAQVVTTAVANFAELRKDGGNILVDLGIAAIDALIPVVTGALSTALIQAFAFLGPIGGPIAAGAITALAAVSLAALRGALAEMESQKAASGVVDISGPGTDTSDNLNYWVSPGESIVTAKGTRAAGNKKLLKWMNKSGKSWMEFAKMQLPTLTNWTPPQLELSDIVVTPAGEAPDLLPLIRATQEQTERLEQKFDDQYRLEKWKQKEEREFRKRMEKKAGSGEQTDLFEAFARV